MRKTSDRWKNDKLIKKDYCFECGFDGDLHFHHVVPEGRGGTKTIPLCLICHGKVHNLDFVRMKKTQVVGIKKAKLEGKFTGRKVGSLESPKKFLNKSKNKKIIEFLLEGKTYEVISQLANCSQSTIVKVKKLYETHNQTTIINPNYKRKEVFKLI